MNENEIEELKRRIASNRLKWWWEDNRVYFVVVPVGLVLMVFGFWLKLQLIKWGLASGW